MTMMVGTTSTWSMKLLPGETLEEAEASMDRVMDALLDIEEAERQVHSAAVSVNLADMTVEIDLAVDCDDLDDAVALVDDAIRRALQAAGHRLNTGARLRKHAEVLEPA